MTKITFCWLAEHRKGLDRDWRLIENDALRLLLGLLLKEFILLIVVLLLLTHRNSSLLIAGWPSRLIILKTWLWRIHELVDGCGRSLTKQIWLCKVVELLATLSNLSIIGLRFIWWGSICSLNSLLNYLCFLKTSMLLSWCLSIWN